MSGICSVPTRAKVRIAVVVAVTMFQAGCAGPARQGAAREDPRVFVESFLRNVVAADHEAAFASLEIDALVNYGRPQGERYRSLSPRDRERYRRDFVEGVYAFLFRDAPPARAVFEVAAPAPGSLTLGVTGRPGKRLLVTLRHTPGGYRIVQVEKAEGAGR